MSDLLVKELIEKANAALDRYPNATVFFKYTCDQCGSRQTFKEANTLWQLGACEECGHVTAIREGGFLLVLDLA